MSASTFQKICTGLNSVGTKLLILSGRGEPLLHSKVFEFISIAKDNNLQVMMFTNGTLLNDEIINSIIESRLDILKVSLWASNQEEYRKNYPGSPPEYFDIIVGNLKRISHMKKIRNKTKPNIVLCRAINRNNYLTSKAYIDLASETGCNGVYFTPTSFNAGKEVEKLILNKKEENYFCQPLVTLIKDTEKKGISHNFNDIILRFKHGRNSWEGIPCYSGWYNAYINVDGNVYPCIRCNIPISNINRYTFSEIFQNEKYNNFREGSSSGKHVEYLNRICNCELCCLYADNYRIHQIFKWFSFIKTQNMSRVFLQ